MNLEKLKVEELKTEELVSVEGGSLIEIFVGALVGMALSQDIDSLIDSFKEGYGKARKV